MAVEGYKPGSAMSGEGYVDRNSKPNTSTTPAAETGENAGQTEHMTADQLYAYVLGIHTEVEAGTVVGTK